MNMRCILSIVSHGQGDLVSDLLSDLHKIQLSPGLKVSVVITLNIPEDESFLSGVSALDLIVVRNEVPKGFGANHNAAFLTGQSDFFVVLNPDLRIHEFNLFDFLESFDAAVAVMGPRVVDPFYRLEDSFRQFPTLSRVLQRAVFNKRLNDDVIDAQDHLEPDWVAGMFMAFRSSSFVAIEGFDEGYFMYLEDADICRRARRKGFTIAYNPQFTVIHAAQRASRKSIRHFSWHLRSLLRFTIGI